MRPRAGSYLLPLICFASGTAIAASDAPRGVAQAARFAVAQKLSSSWCYGYLTVSGDTLRYEAVQPAECTTQSFVARRFDVQARQWSVLGIPQPAVELHVKGVKFIFEWLADESEVRTGGGWRASPPRAIAPDQLLTVIAAPQAPHVPVVADSKALGVESDPTIGVDTSDRFVGVMPRPVGPVRVNAGIGFIAPEGWSVSENNGAAVMRPPPTPGYEDPCVAVLLPPRPAQGDLVAQAYAIANELFAARFGRLTGDLGADIRGSLYAGVSGTGWEYVELFGVLGDERHLIDGRILLAHMGSQVVPMAAVSKGAPCLGNRYYRDNDNWALLFHSLQVPGYSRLSPTLKQQLVGEWEESGSTTFTSKRYDANGHYGRLDAHASYTESARPGVVVQETRSWDGDGTYAVLGDRIIFTPRKGGDVGNTVTELFRIVRHPNARKPEGFEWMLLEVSHADEPVAGMSRSGNYVYGMVKQRNAGTP